MLCFGAVTRSRSRISHRGANLKRGAKLLFPEECIKTKKIGSRGARPKFYSVEAPLVADELRWSPPSNLACPSLGTLRQKAVKNFMIRLDDGIKTKCLQNSIQKLVGQETRNLYELFS